MFKFKKTWIKPVVISVFSFILISFSLSYYQIFKISNLKYYELNWGFIDSSSAFAESLVNLYNIVWIFLFLVLVTVFVLLCRFIFLFSWNLQSLDNSFIKKGLIYFYKMYILVLNSLNSQNFKEEINIALYKMNLLKTGKVTTNIFYSTIYYDEEFLNISELSEYKKLELIWSLIPAGILGILIGPTFSLLFSLDPEISPMYTIKVIGHQWYWSYEIEGKSFYTNKEYWGFAKHFALDEYIIKYNYNFKYYFDSVMIKEEDLEKGHLRLLEVDNRLVVPACVDVRFLITSTDVLHSWAVPSLGLKVDAVPGRLNQFIVNIKRPGIFFGQCSELCGPMHGFMPIVVQAIDLDNFNVWLYKHAEITNENITVLKHVSNSKVYGNVLNFDLQQSLKKFNTELYNSLNNN